MSRGGVHNALGKGILPSALSRAVGDAEGSSGLERYGETLTPVLDLWAHPEWAYLRNEILLATYGSVGAVAAEYGGAAIVNPVGSGLLLVIESAAAVGGAAAQWQVSRSTADIVAATFATIARGIARDSRWNNTNAPANTAGASLVYSGTDPALIGGAVGRDANAANLWTHFEGVFPVVISPGQALVIQCETVNATANIRFAWRERKAFPGELE